MKHQTDILDAQISQGRVQIKYGFTDDETEKEYLLELTYREYFNYMQKLGYYPDAKIIEGDDETIIEVEHEIWNSFAKEHQDFTFSAEITKVVEDSLWGTANEVLELALEDLKDKEDAEIISLVINQ